jgi:hypothetical protein
VYPAGRCAVFGRIQVRQDRNAKQGFCDARMIKYGKPNTIDLTRTPDARQHGPDAWQHGRFSQFTLAVGNEEVDSSIPRQTCTA